MQEACHLPLIPIEARKYRLCVEPLAILVSRSQTHKFFLMWRWEYHIKEKMSLATRDYGDSYAQYFKLNIDFATTETGMPG